MHTAQTYLEIDSRPQSDSFRKAEAAINEVLKQENDSKLWRTKMRLLVKRNATESDLISSKDKSYWFGWRKITLFGRYRNVHERHRAHRSRSSRHLEGASATAGNEVGMATETCSH